MSAVALDLDNTLTDRPPIFDSWARSFLARHAIDDPEGLELLRRLDDDGFGDKARMFRTVRDRWGLTESVEDLVEAYYDGMVQRTVMPDASRRALARLARAGCAILVVTNGSVRQEDKIDRLGLAERVDGVAVSAVVGSRKPEPGIFAAAAADAGLGLTDISWMVGDTPQADIRGAAAIGARSVWLSRGREWPLDDLAPTVTSASLSEAVDAILVADPTAGSTRKTGG